MAPPLILFAHGAGAPSSSGWMRAWAVRLRTLGQVVTFDYPYMQEGRKMPDRAPVLIAAHREALQDATTGPDGSPGTRPVILAGKSMGSRMGCHLAVELAREGHPVTGLVCFGYPLRGIGKGPLRDAVLRELATPILFLQGSRDPLCPLDELAKVRSEMSAPSRLFVVDGGDHSLAVRKRAAAAAESGPRSQEEWDAAVLAEIATFFATLS